MNVSSHFTTYKQIYLSLLLFLIIFCVLGIPFSNWGFKTDDWGNIYHCTTRTLGNFFGFFSEKSIEVFNHPSNAAPCEQAFFCGLYRPLSFIYYALQYTFFGNNPYGYFLVLIAFHAFSAVALFNIFSTMATTTFAFIVALYFGFHPSLWNWLGWISAQTYFIELFFLIVLLLLLKYALDHYSWWAYLLSSCLFLSNLFLREQTFFLPMWLIWATAIYLKLIVKKELTFRTAIFKGFIISIGYWMASIFYITIRLHQLPLTSNTTSLTFQPNWQSFITRMSERTFDFVSYIVDMYGLSFIPNNHHIMKGILVFCITLVLLLLFLKNTSKTINIFLIFSLLLFSWPALLMHCQPRYSYMALPFFILLVITLVPLPTTNKKFISFFYLFFLLLIINNGNFLYTKLRQREAILHRITTVFTTLVKNPTIQEKSLCFLDLPSVWFHEGTAQAIWLLRNNNTYPVFQHDIPISQINILKQLYRELNPVYITWNYKNLNFLILNPNP